MALPVDPWERQRLQDLQTEFPEYQQYLQDRFELYRRGDQDHSRSLDRIKWDYGHGFPARFNSIRARQVPRVNYSAQLNDGKRRVLAPLAELARDSFRRRAQARVANLTQATKNVATGEFRRATAMMTAKKNFAFVKILGAGGNGIVVLWKWAPGGNPLEQGHYVVMKLTSYKDGNGNPDYDAIVVEKGVMLVSGASPRRVFVVTQVPE